jgi:Ni,Fe-hydrogenase III small subunit
MTTGGIAATVPVDIWLAGSPPSPFGIINALLVAVGKLAPDTPLRARLAGPTTPRGGRRSR